MLPFILAGAQFLLGQDERKQQMLKQAASKLGNMSWDDLDDRPYMGETYTQIGAKNNGSL